MQDLVNKLIKMVVLRNVIKIDLIVDINVNKFVIQIKSVNNFLVKQKY
jgi:hypothetical protein